MSQVSLTNHVDIISNYADFQKLKEDWNRLYLDDPQAQFFLSWSWLDQVFSHYRKDWFILAVRQPGQINNYIAFLPLRMHTRMSKSKKLLINEIRVAGRYTWSDYSGIICHPKYEQQAIVQLATALKKMHWRSLYLKNLLISKHRLNLFTKEFDEKRFKHKYLEQTGSTDNVNRLLCPCIDLPETYELYLTERTSKNTRQKLRRFMRKLDNSDNFKITHSNSKTLQSDLDILMNLWMAKWSKFKGTDTHRLARKYRQILEFGFKNNALFMPILWDEDKPIAALGSFIDTRKKSILYFIAGRDERYTNIPGGLLLHAHSIQWSINKGFKHYHFLRGNERFKYSLGGVDKHIVYLVISHRAGVNLNQTPDPLFLYQAIEKGRGYGRTMNYEKARGVFQEVLETDPNNIPANYYMGQTLLKLKQADQAALNLNKTLELKTGQSESTRKIQAQALKLLNQMNS